MKTIGLVVYPDFQILALSVATVFEFANLTTGRNEYEVTLLSEHGGSVRSSMGFAVETACVKGRKFHTLIVAGDSGGAPQGSGVAAYVRQAVNVSQRVAATCTGAFVLAEAGLLDGRRATTHWYFARALQQANPLAKIEEDRIFVVDGPIWTSAGATAGIDLALAMVEEDLGAETARIVARKRATSVERWSDWCDRSEAEASISFAAVPVTVAESATPAMLLVTSPAPTAAWATLRTISLVAAPCSSTAAATEADTPLISWMRALMLSMARTA